MELMVDDNNIRACLRGLKDGRRRLCIDYPRDDRYESLVRTALANLLQGPATVAMPPTLAGNPAEDHNP